MVKKLGLYLLVICLAVSFSGCASNSPKEVTDLDVKIILKASDGTSNEYTGKYTGTTVNKVPNGEGVFVSKNSDESEWTYRGNFTDGVAAGKATVDNLYLTVPLPEGAKVGFYSGDVEDGVPNGVGTYKTKNSSNVEYSYSGDFKNGLYDGKGYLTFNDNGSVIKWGGTFVKGAFTPTKSELMSFIVANYNVYGYFEVDSQTADLIDNHDEIFNTADKNIIPSDLIVEYNYKKMNKSLKDYYGKLVQFKAEVLQIFEVNTNYGDVTVMSVYDSNDNVSAIYYFGTIDIYEDDKITVIATPAAVGSFKNIIGGTTNVIEFVATYIKKTK